MRTRTKAGATWRCAWCAGWSFLFSLATALAARGETTSEYALKAAYLYNIAKFVTWPDSVYRANHDSLVIAITGGDPFGPELDKLLAGRTAGGRPIRLRRVSSGAELRKAQVVFVNQLDPVAVTGLLKQSPPEPFGPICG